MQAQQMKEVIERAIREVDPAGSGQLTTNEAKCLFKVLGWSDEKIAKLFEFAGSENSAGNVDQFMDWLYSKIDNTAGPSDTGGKAKPKKTLSSGQDAPTLGVIRLDYDYPAAPGDIDSPESYMYDVLYRVVPGLTFQICQDNAMTPEIKSEFIEAVKYLEDKGVSGITGDCGFMMWFQELARQHTKKPVFMSSLAHLPAVTAATHDQELIAVLTANGKTLEPMRDLIKRECNIDTEDKRLVIVGCEDCPGFEAVALGEKVDVPSVLPGIVKKTQEVIKHNPMIRAILLECTELPPYADALRAATGLPVFDAITNCDYFIRARMDNPLVGKNDWQQEWDCEQEEYHFGQNLDAGDRAKIVNKAALNAVKATANASSGGDLGKLTVHSPDYLKADVASLGVLRLDIEYTPHPGDVAYPQSFAYPVYYRVVKGLSYDMCKEKLSPAMEEELEAAIKFLDDLGVSGITCDCNLGLLFQEKAAQLTKRMVFMSPLAQLPAVSAAFGKTEQILLVTGWENEFEPCLDVIESMCKINPRETRFVVAGCQDIKEFKDYVMKPSKPGKAELTQGLLAVIRKKREENPKIRAIVVECTALSVFADDVRADSGLPVFDIMTMCDLFMNGRMDNPLFGLNGWQKNWDGKQNKYVLGQHLPGQGPHVDVVGQTAKHTV